MDSYLPEIKDQSNFQNGLLSALRQINEVLLSTLDINLLCQSIVNLIMDPLGYEFGAIALVDKKENKLRRVAISFSSNPEVRKALRKILDDLTPVKFEEQAVSLDENDNFLVRAFNEKKSLYTEKLYDIQKGIFDEATSKKIEDGLKGNYHDFKGIYIYPLVTKNGVLGTIYYASLKDISHTPDTDFLVMDNFADEVARALDNAMLYQNLLNDKSIISTERNKMSLVLSGIKDAVVAVDLKRNVVLFNKAAENLTGYTFQEVFNRPVDSFIKVSYNNEEIPVEEYCPIRVDGYEGIILNKNDLKLVGHNKEAFVNIIAGQIKEGFNSNLGCILTLHDITEEMNLEEMKLDFVSMAAHELRTPLTSIRGYLSVLMEENKDKFNPEQNLFLSRINISTQQLVALIENLLSVTKIERGAFSVNLAPVEWVAIVRETVSQFQDRAKEKKINLSFTEPEKGEVKVLADQLRITEVLSNLLSNAVSYTQENGSITVGIEDTPTEVITHVKDTGEGIPKEAMSHLFTKFFRVAGKLAQGSKGTGLGLYISKAIMEMHHGKIWVESEVNKGSTFSFSLPKP